MSAISATAGSAVSATGVDKYSELGSDEFLQIILTEMSNQDPLDPNDTSQLLDQLSSIRSIESDINLTDQLEKLVAQDQLAAASDTIGKAVTGLTEDGRRVAEIVASVSRTQDGIVLNLRDGSRVPMDRVDEIITQEELLLGGTSDDDDETGNGSEG
ncbi:MAG: flagellar hook capping FlgD N-terminal domain-containing protein [Planctomycetota bacterium]